MNLPIVALSVTALIFVTYSVDAFAQPQHGGVDKEGSWYVGENLRVGDYFSYDMCHMNYKNCAEFNMRIWFKEEVLTRDGPRWITETAVIDGDRIIVGNMTLGDRSFNLVSISPELREYGKAFESSVPWMSYFVSDGWDSDGNRGEKFTDVWHWRPTSISWTWLMPTDTEDITVPAGSWEDAVIISYHRGPDHTDNIWIADEFPFPIKADMDAYVVGDPTRELAFTLVDYGNLQENPFVGMVSTSELERAACEARSGGTVPVMKATDDSKYQIRASYGPEHPEEWCWIELSVEFLGRDGLLVEQVQFDVVVLDDDGDITRSVAGELGSRTLYAQSGTYHLEFDVREPPGIAEYAIVVYGTAPDWVVPDQSERDVLAIPMEVRPNAGMAIPEPDGNALANEVGHARSPLEQVRDGVPADKVACSDGRVLIKSPSDMPACVFESSVDVLVQRGFVKISVENSKKTSDDGAEQYLPLRRPYDPPIADHSYWKDITFEVVAGTLDELRTAKHAPRQASSEEFVVADWIPDYIPNDYKLVYTLHTWNNHGNTTNHYLRLYFTPDSFNFTSTTTETDIRNAGGIFYYMSPNKTDRFDSYERLKESFAYLAGPVDIINQTNGYFGAQKPDNEYDGFSVLAAFDTHRIHISTSADLPHVEGTKMINSIQGVLFPE